MKIKRIISSILLVAVVFTSLVVAFPTAASAAYSSVDSNSGSTATANLSKDEIKVYLDEYLKYNYQTAEEMLMDELEAGYLYSKNSSNNYYSLYVNKYTGFVFYRNNITGQILTSNPVDPGYLNASGALAVGQASTREKLMSQIELKFYESANPDEGGTFTSFTESARRSQITVNQISNGFRVSYVLGDTDTRFLLPGAVIAEKFEESIIIPMIEAYISYFKEICEEYAPDYNFDFFENEEDYIPYTESGFINLSSDEGFIIYIENASALAKQCYGSSFALECRALDEIGAAITKIKEAYTLEDPAEYPEGSEWIDKIAEKYPIFKEGVAIYTCDIASTEVVERRLHAKYIQTYCPEYTFAEMEKDERDCGYVNQEVQKPVFRCALEYSFNSDGSISVKLPASSISFDETKYSLDYIKPLEFFGCADVAKTGYVFFPDGSGTVIEFNDFYRPGSKTNPNLKLEAGIYGSDYAYSNITGAHRQQVTMPVYGVVTEVNANPLTSATYGTDTVMNGYFAIIEEGASLGTLYMTTQGNAYKYGTAYATYNPYPNEEFEIVNSEGTTSIFTMLAKSKYSGSYTTRYAMLCDTELGEVAYGADKYFESSYVGMASYYKNYLKANGTLTALEKVSEDIPLYIEALGAMDIMTKVLSFPVSKSIPLTTFDNVLTMQNELAGAKDIALQKAAENDTLAAEATDEALKAEYTAKAAEYRAFADAIQNISNINFKLTGFTNGGMKSTYPTKVRWERACGGASGFEALVAESSKISETAGVNFGVYADFDLMYISNTAMFDGISNKGNVSKMIDNRYASKQIYDSSMKKFNSLFDLAISSDALDKLYTKFEKNFAESGSKKLSLSTIGSNLNSNFDEKNFITREGAVSDIQALLSKVTAIDKYELMLDVGNIYTVKYATHLLNVATDSSHFRYSSYTVPFTGLVLHSYVNYTGTPLNYSGNVQYEILKSIENGAAPYYILCYQNSAYLKEDSELNHYYGVSYENWYHDIVTTYATLNAAIGGLQDYEISDHRIVVCERVIEKEEQEANYVLLKNEIAELLEKQLEAVVDKAYTELRESAEDSEKLLELRINAPALFYQFAEILNVPVNELLNTEFSEKIDSIMKKYVDEYPPSENSYVVTFDAIEYTSKYSFITDSFAFDKNYVTTDYTVDNGNVTMVTYRKGDSRVSFLINYNNFSVNVRLANGEVKTLERFSFQKI